MSPNHIDFSVQDSDGSIKWKLTGVCGWPKQLLCDLNSSQVSWLAFGTSTKFCIRVKRWEVSCPTLDVAGIPLLS